MKKVIGFATQFYTLWNYEAETTYRTDSQGNHYKSGVTHKYYYVKNVSKDLDKVKQLFPNVEIDLSLRGCSDFVRTEKIDLPDNVFWRGKYQGQLIDDVIEADFNYCLWVVEKYSNTYIINHPKYIAYFKAIEDAKNELISKANFLKVGDVVEVEFEKNGYNGWFSDGGKIERFDSDDSGRFEYDRCYTKAKYGNVNLIIETPCKPVYGMYPYLMPVINGKAQRTKGKTIKVEVAKVLSSDTFNGEFIQCVIVK